MSIEDAMKAAARDCLEHVLGEYLELWRAKQSDYGWQNIGLFQARGVFIRLCDKLLRLKCHYMDGAQMQNESIEDTWKDIVGYGLIGLVCVRGLWPEFNLEDIKDESPHLPP